MNKKKVIIAIIMIIFWFSVGYIIGDLVANKEEFIQNQQNVLDLLNRIP